MPPCLRDHPDARDDRSHWGRYPSRAYPAGWWPRSGKPAPARCFNSRKIELPGQCDCNHSTAFPPDDRLRLTIPRCYERSCIPESFVIRLQTLVWEDL